jgi:hypothetical protein
MTAEVFAFLEKHAALAPFASTLILATSLWVGLLQIRKNRENQLRASAIALWDKYLDRTIQYPKFAFPEGFEDSLRYLEEQRIDDSRETFEQYEWFVAGLLRTSSEILGSYDKSPERYNMVRRNICYHKRYIKYKPSGFFKDLGPGVESILTEIELLP